MYKSVHAHIYPFSYDSSIRRKKRELRGLRVQSFKPYIHSEEDVTDEENLQHSQRQP